MRKIMIIKNEKILKWMRNIVIMEENIFFFMDENIKIIFL